LPPRPDTPALRVIVTDDVMGTGDREVRSSASRRTEGWLPNASAAALAGKTLVDAAYRRAVILLNDQIAEGGHQEATQSRQQHIHAAAG